MVITPQGPVYRHAVTITTLPIASVDFTKPIDVSLLSEHAVISSQSAVPYGSSVCSYPAIAREFPEMDHKFRKWLAINPDAPYPEGHPFYHLWYFLFRRSPSYHAFKRDPLNHLKYDGWFFVHVDVTFWDKKKYHRVRSVLMNFNFAKKDILHIVFKPS